ncbi:hypothetical protein [Costertonia aggregata]|uniref:Uncharacterized protein n=1 Tax=Costertonia aggregata TaxID=343403 RepID=A0A7H9AS85_9FLAO|nr:hypothetical protein [Costertonia aggregata]QLG46361.1 hypothetical protein HYG79_13725 [Costertonia aggregata]
MIKRILTIEKFGVFNDFNWNRDSTLQTRTKMYREAITTETGNKKFSIRFYYAESLELTYSNHNKKSAVTSSVFGRATTRTKMYREAITTETSNKKFSIRFSRAESIELT